MKINYRSAPPGSGKTHEISNQACNLAEPMRSSPPVIVTPPSSRFCPWSALRPPHDTIRKRAVSLFLGTRRSSYDGHWP